MPLPAFLDIIHGTADDLFAHLGPRPHADRRRLTAFAPEAKALSAKVDGRLFPMNRVPGAPEIFEGDLPREGGYALVKTRPTAQC